MSSSNTIVAAGSSPQSSGTVVSPSEANSSKQLASRYVRVQDLNVAPLLTVGEVMKANTETFDSSIPVERSSNVFLKFDNLIDAFNAKEIFELNGLNAHFIEQRTFAHANYQDPSALDPTEGTMAIKIVTPHQQVATSEACMGTIVRAALSRFGDIREITMLKLRPQSGGYAFTYRVDFYSVDAAVRATNVVRTQRITGPSSMNIHFPDWFTVAARLWRDMWTPTATTTNTSVHGLLVNPIPHSRQSARHYNGEDSHNVVDLHRILRGLDVRPTLMLRNIPNKMDWLSLKRLLDQYCFGSFDFVYLRIDFKTQANVGYAFINFADLNGMVAFVSNVSGRLWPGFHSHKAAAMSYATVQGKEALIAKFRNSSVMKETPNCKPRLFVTIQDASRTNSLALIGSEQPFPSPDNLTKLQRSCDSARQVGLFPPRSARPTNLPDRRARIGTHDAGNPRENFEQHLYRNNLEQHWYENVPKHMKGSCEQLGPWNFYGNQYNAYGSIPPQIIDAYFNHRGAHQ